MTLVERLRAREPRAFVEAYEAHGQPLYNFLRRLCGDAHLASDLFQETWLQLVRHAPRLRGDSNLGAWLFVVGRNQFRKHRRFVLVDGDRLRALRWALQNEAAAPMPAASTAQLERALETLPIADREILLLQAQSDLAQDALAEALGIRYTVFRQRLGKTASRASGTTGGDHRAARAEIERALGLAAEHRYVFALAPAANGAVAIGLAVYTALYLATIFSIAFNF
jgi:RNA polymerase sigma-70 factor (ECF subfamily)